MPTSLDLILQTSLLPGNSHELDETCLSEDVEASKIYNNEPAPWAHVII